MKCTGLAPDAWTRFTWMWITVADWYALSFVPRAGRTVRS